MKRKKVLVLGSGGRESAIVLKLAGDPGVKKIYCAPGNAQTAMYAKNVKIDINNNTEVLWFVIQNAIDLTVVGPEAPLANGIVNDFEFHGRLILGPTKYAAQLESSKIFARELMEECDIPQPTFFVCKNKREALRARQINGLPIVVKADGLAGGKGVIVCHTEEKFQDALIKMFDKQTFSSAPNRVLVEECLQGEELSLFAICDGANFKLLGTAQDHKRIGEGDTGDNTGGMGAYSPTPLSTPALLKKVEEKIVEPVLREMRARMHPFGGILYVGLMIVDSEPFVIEFNVRFGDPEAQVILPLFKSSLFDLFYKAAQGRLNEAEVKISSETAVTVVLAAEGYPHEYPKGMVINGLEKLGEDDLVFHAGTKINGGEIISTGGRVLNAVGFGDSLESAIKDAYRVASKIHFDNMYYRRDIGQRGLNYPRT
jgi:phosphoribosylamine--glycine ligase